LFQYTVRRVVIALVTLLGITVITYVLINMMPGDPAALMSDVGDPRVSAERAIRLRKLFELDKPVLERYVAWLGKIARGDLGVSFQDSRPVAEKIVERLPATTSLSAISILIGLAIAFPIGLLQAARHNGWFDRVTGVFFYALFAIPSYVGAILLIYFVGVKEDLLPFRGMTSDDFETMGVFAQWKDLVAHFTLITICTMYPGLAFDTRFVRANMLEVVRQDYIRTARAKGLPGHKVILKHAFRNTLIPVITRLAHVIPALISGSVILEVIFNWPGLGRLFYEAIQARDYPVMMASLVVSSSLVLLGILLADLCYAFADPRISYD
jgi:peptide/nickel transport system permease protein